MNEREIFIAALQKQDLVERRAYLAEVCADNSGLRMQVDDLLRLYESAGSFLEQPAAGQATSNSPTLEGAGTRIGPYTLVEQIGEGGMGTVWKAEQVAPFTRFVAIKLIKAGMDSKQVIARFEAERQALALMDHPNIARVLDAGATSDEASGVGSGRPYFVMELVNGVPITQYCDEHHLTPRQRLELFIPVCQAIQHAHQKGVIHRDLKPSNVLVALCDGKPTPKVIDFGVAKAAGQPLTEKTVVTGFGAIIGTLEYMSPEQAEVNQIDVDTRSDVYSLGVLLYELLTGTTPLQRKRVKDAALLELLRVIREEEPPKPSTRLSTTEGLPSIAAQRRTEPAKLTKQLRGELDWIVMRALEKDRNRRYATANGFALDMQRYLADESVSAGPPSTVYRFRKFARRNWRGLSAVAAFVLILVSAVTALTIALIAVNRERRDKEAALAAEVTRQRQAREALDALSSQVFEDLLARQPVLTAGHKRFLEEALRRYEEFTADTGHGEEARFGLARAVWGVALIRYRLDQRAEATRDWERCRDLFCALVTDLPAVASYREYLARVEYNLGLCYLDTNRPAESEQALNRCRAVSRELAAEFPNISTGARYESRALNRLAAHYLAAGRVQESEAAYGAVLALLNRLTAAPSADRDDLFELASAHLGLANLQENIRRPNDAIRSYETSAEILTRLVASGAAEPQHRDGLVRALNALGVSLRVARRFPEAQQALDRAVAVGRPLVAGFPGVAKYRMALGMALNNLGILHKNEGRTREAEAAYREAMTVHKQLADDSPANPNYQNEAAGAMVNLARLLQADGDAASARRLLEEAGPYHQAALKANPQHQAFRQYYRNNRWRLAETLLALNDHTAAAAATREFLQFVTQPARDAYTAAGLLAGCARLAAQDERLSEDSRREIATAYGDQAVAALHQAIGQGAEEVARMKDDPRLAPLRPREDFKKLLAEQRAK